MHISHEDCVIRGTLLIFSFKNSQILYLSSAAITFVEVLY